MMVLTVSVDHVEVVYAVFNDTKLVEHGHLPYDSVFSPPDSLGARRFQLVAVVSVAPSRTDQVISFLAQHYGGGIQVFARDVRLEMDIQSEMPGEVAADRLLAAAAAYARIKGPVLIVSVGPTLTVDAVSHTGAFCGGAMVPGPRMMLTALHRQTETVPAISLSGQPAGFGRNVADTVRSGVFWGTVGTVEKLMDKVGGEALGRHQVLLTGVDGEWVGKELSSPHEYVPVLALEGLALAVNRQRP